MQSFVFDLSGRSRRLARSGAAKPARFGRHQLSPGGCVIDDNHLHSARAADRKILQNCSSPNSRSFVNMGLLGKTPAAFPLTEGLIRAARPLAKDDGDHRHQRCCQRCCQRGE